MSYFWVLADPVINITFFSVIFGNFDKIDLGKTSIDIFSRVLSLNSEIYK